MKKILITVVLAAVLPMPGTMAVEGLSDRPNVVHIMIDDLG